MKSAHNLLHWRLLLVVVLVLGGTMTGGAAGFRGNRHRDIIGDAFQCCADVGQQITVPININMSGVTVA